MSKEFEFRPFPKRERKPKEVKTHLEKDTIKQFDAAYRAFWKKRGKRPPSVSSHFIDIPCSD